MQVGTLLVDWDRGILAVNGQRIACTWLQLSILAALAHAHGRVLSQGWLIDAVWEDQERTVRSLKQHIYNIRKKLGSEGWRLQTVRGIGYRLESE